MIPTPAEPAPTRVLPALSGPPALRGTAVAAALALILTACASVIQPAGETCPPTTGQEIVERMNAVRADADLEPLVVDLRLVRTARAHARSMKENDFFGHIGPDGVEPRDRVTATGYAWTFVAENLAAGDLTPTQVVAGWLESPLHRDNMLEHAAVHVGVGYANDGSRYEGYWTAVFAATEGEVETPRDGCHP